jgi:hypothetical protein
MNWTQIAIWAIALDIILLTGLVFIMFEELKQVRERLAAINKLCQYLGSRKADRNGFLEEVK